MTIEGQASELPNSRLMLPFFGMERLGCQARLARPRE